MTIQDNTSDTLTHQNLESKYKQAKVQEPNVVAVQPLEEAKSVHLPFRIRLPGKTTTTPPSPESATAGIRTVIFHGRSENGVDKERDATSHIKEAESGTS